MIGQCAYANMGTALMWVEMLHMVYGNFVIGVLEGLILAFAFRLSKWKTIVLLILANYASAFAGHKLLMAGVTSRIDITIENMRFWYWALMLIAFVLTLLIELPFFAIAMRKLDRKWLKIPVAVLVMHGISYALMLAYFGSYSRTSLLTDFEAVPVREIASPAGYTLRYVTRDGQTVIQEGFTPGSTTAVADTKSTDKDWRMDWKVHQVGVSRDWNYDSGFWASDGISRMTGDDVTFRCALETPFIAWPIRRPFHIAGDFVVMQLGDDQICLLDPMNKKIALVARGYDLVVETEGG